MTVQSEQRSRPSAILTRRNEISLGTTIRLDRISWGAKYSAKVRKPYTITKQREKWTEEEHNKFLEALKLYGRAWRRIEEYVGTKTTVQIRSHAQKFFSKVVRDSSGGSMDIIDIPPPRPKRKPIHPYPRKPVNPLINTEVSNEDQQRSLSPNSSVLEQEQQSPTSVISAVGSGSSTPSPIEELGFSSPPPLTDPVAVASVLNEKLELFPNLCERRKDEAKEASACAQSFKLFGKMLLFSDAEDSASNFEDMNVEKPREMFPWLTLSSKNPTRASLQHGSAELGRVEDGEVLNNRHWDEHETRLGDKESNLDLGLNARSKKRGFLFGSRVSLKSHEGCTKGFVPYKRLK